MRARVMAARITLTALMLAATAGLTAPPAYAVVCRRVPAQCQLIVDELRKHGVCEVIPATSDQWQTETAFCDDPDGWSTNITRGVVGFVCPEARCDRLIQEAVERITACLSDLLRCNTQCTTC